MWSGAVSERAVSGGGRRRRRARMALLAVAAAVTVTTIAACSTAAGDGFAPGKIAAIGAENQYADVISQIGGKYVQANAILSNPNTDPHTFEASPAVAREVSAAQLIVQNGSNYDSFISTIENAVPSNGSRVIDVQQLLGLPDPIANPHLWYSPTTMPKVADAIAADLAAIQPAHAAYFKARAEAFIDSLGPWYRAIAAFKQAYSGVPVATTEPVADYLLAAAGADNLTPWAFQDDVMNGIDPSPQDVAAQEALFTDHKVKVFLYNQQVTDPLTQSLITLAHQNGIPVVGVYETMPVPGYDYQTWMLTEVQDLRKAVADKISTEHL